MVTTRSQTAQDRETIAEANEPGQAALADENHGSNGVRLRQTTSTQFITNDTTWRHQPTKPDEPPRFTIDLSLPPEQRYLEICTALKSEITGLTTLFDEVVGGMVPFLPLKWLHFFCRMLLRAVYNREENAELQGISKATGVSLYLLVCFNVLLDLFMGCSSGGASIRDEDGGSKMVHFRTLDWDMPALRRVIVHLDFIMQPGAPVVASSITYAGFVGVLTGVRKGFSVSLNFRPCHNDAGKFSSDAKYAWHLLLVLLGWRPSIASTLRSYLLPHHGTIGRQALSAPLDRNSMSPTGVTSYSDVVQRFTGSCQAGGKQPRIFVSTACYLCFCSGDETMVVEKDRITAKFRSSDDFIVITNNDETDPVETDATPSEAESPFATALAEIVHEAKDRQQCAEHNWNNMRVAKAEAAGLRRPSQDELKALLDVDNVVTLVQRYPTTNEATHFACVMDPKEGTTEKNIVVPMGSKAESLVDLRDAIDRGWGIDTPVEFLGPEEGTAACAKDHQGGKPRAWFEARPALLQGVCDSDAMTIDPALETLPGGRQAP
ncbi:hypothetical protein LTR36_004488 [Oleoguttula mirabilis]|uniref:ceramidase n=1 Tax=Oleoguttula mirabilis TaxID=1507867 RepID=A0AAV9JG29_9PEZI|nr:hypothetical protein LTR36_004488 [Oleoguttula mirabilis]